MDERSLAFLQVMIALGIIAVVAFLIFLLTGLARRGQPAGAPAGNPADNLADSGSVTGAPRPARYTPQWWEFALALIVLVAAAIVFLWQFGPAELFAGLGAGGRELAFFIVMAIVAVLALIVFFIAMIVRSVQANRIAAFGGEAAASETDAPAAAIETPSGLRLLGLLLFAVLFLLLNWIYLPRTVQFALMHGLVYPASFVVAVVLLFDKASRAWSMKGGAEVFREWLFVDALIILLILGFLNLSTIAAPDGYAVQFWDLLGIVLFFVVIWLVDRKITRYRFLIAYLYLIALPILLLIWRFIQEVPAPEDLSWWSTIWPFFIWAIIGSALEIIFLLIPATANSHGAPAAKDVVFLAVYAILLMVAMPAAPA